MEPLQRGLLH